MAGKGRPRIKRAVIVGINKYQGDGIDLNGCVADAIDFYKTLRKHFKFKKKNIRLLLDEDATKENILNSLNWMISKTKSKQEAVYFQSGHGSQISDSNNDEWDGLDECIIPYDFNYEKVIVDDEIAAIFKQLNSHAYLSMVCDTCYSGGASKGINNSNQKTIASITENKSDLITSHFGIKDISPTTQRHVLLSGCREGQYCEEFYHPKYGYRGVLSFILCRNLYNYRRSPLPFHKLFVKVNQKIIDNGYSQRPTLVGLTSLCRRTAFGGKR